MNAAYILIIPMMLVLVETVWAEPVKCVIDGKTMYTDDASRCAKASAKPISNNVSVFPKVQPTTGNPGVVTPLESPAKSMSDSILGRFGVSQEEIANGWKTITDAKKRGSWKAPDMPDDAQ
ncbi:MAG: hypothetical protein M0R33_19560 [Methylomonas sp.]|jgi:hypothetical protein|uniref:hypothetical protein n=1 Tax=Methylomonas sp. TaxID=418 RepID=UPI0025EED602|nr:hypothetical protein [Methylomonas sp.]MCK9608645.1 hypothetical protein [Methylomonas sp.]